jgi:hypothetical protein
VSSSTPSLPACPWTQRGSSRAFITCSALRSPPAALTASTSAFGAFARPSSRAKNATVVLGSRSFRIGARCCLMSASFQRSVPSTITNRRPIANVIALSAAAAASGVDSSPSSTSAPFAPDSCSAIFRSFARRSASRPWSSPWIRYAGFQAGIGP